MIHGIIDIGSNTIRMAVYQVESDRLELLIKKKYTIGLAAHIQENRMQQEGIDRACEVLEKFKNFLQTFHIEHVTAFTTAALRNVENSAAAVAEIEARTGVAIRVISGEEEARFDFIGATRAMEIKDGILIDIGGASTELVLYEDGRVERMVSLSIGSLAMHAKHVAGLLPARAEARAIREDVLALLKESAALFQPGGGWEICAIGGSFKAIWQLGNVLQGLPAANCEIRPAYLAEMLERFLCDDGVVSPETLELLARVVPERIKTVVPGLIIAAALAEYFASERIVYSDSGMREGYLYDQVIGKIPADFTGN